MSLGVKVTILTLYMYEKLRANLCDEGMKNEEGVETVNKLREPCMGWGVGLDVVQGRGRNFPNEN